VVASHGAQWPHGPSPALSSCSDAGGAVDLASAAVALSLLPSMSTMPSLSHPFGAHDGRSRGLVPQSVDVACIHGMARGCGSVAM